MKGGSICGGTDCCAPDVMASARLFQSHHAAPTSSSVPSTLPIATPALVPAGRLSSLLLLLLLLFGGATVTVAGEGGGCDVGLVEGEAELVVVVAAAATDVDSGLLMLK